MEGKLAHHTTKRISPGKWYPLGATLQPDGVNFAIYSKYAQEVYLLLFDTSDGAPSDTIKLKHRTRHIWHAFVQGIKPGQLYGYKVYGEYNPAQGMRFNEHKLLIDPYAKALTGECIDRDNLLVGYDPKKHAQDLHKDERDNVEIVPKCIVIDDAFDWQGDAPPAIPLGELIIYEVHLKGFTAHPSSGVKEPGTYRGFIEKIPHLKDLGINAVELLPIHQKHTENRLRRKGLVNYWGYMTVGFFAPESTYGSRRYPGCQVEEFKTLVRELHKEGIEVILDVVYNHTAEGDHLGPTICFRGVDNPTYYRLRGGSHEPYRFYRNYTGCGNTLNLDNGHVMRFVLDSLRYWTETMHVDGFRFDLAAALGRETDQFHNTAAFFKAVSQDPVLQQVKLIAEPWDSKTYQAGNFPQEWSEWNGKFRDTVRRFVRGDNGQIRDLGWRLTGSADLFGHNDRFPRNSINFVACHDGFTLHDLVSYNEKHNDGNGEHNRDGTDANYSWNCGAEGQTADSPIVKLRKQQAKNFLCCLFLSIGTPMMLAGDELLRTQGGNNNAYCQDNEVSWFDWSLLKQNSDIHEFCKKAIQFRKQYPIVRRENFFLGKDTDGDAVPDIDWFGLHLNPPQWDNPEIRMLCYQLDGSEEASELGDYHLFFILNGDEREQPVNLPGSTSRRWLRVVDTSLRSGEDFLAPGKEVPVQDPALYYAKPRSLVVLLAM